ncbi:hypothetical protein B0H14DRAFT_2828381 [Mycena olivaceomarginata]|nr:hypothetical protein B0H14DRAFT_2828381 [Mycena olivaceomarginata]
MPPIQPPLLPLSMLSCHLQALIFGISYVGSLYIAKNRGSRDDPAVIRARLTAVALATLFNCGVVYALAARSTLPSFDRSFASALAILGAR